MTGKMRAWAKSVPPETKQKMWSELKEAGINEARFARDDIRQKLIEEGWSGSVQTPRGIKTYAADASEETAQEEGVDIQGNPIEGEDFSGTVWGEENRNGIEPPAPDAPDIQPPEDGIEPD